MNLKDAITQKLSRVAMTGFMIGASSSIGLVMAAKMIWTFFITTLDWLYVYLIVNPLLALGFDLKANVDLLATEMWKFYDLLDIVVNASLLFAVYGFLMSFYLLVPPLMVVLQWLVRVIDQVRERVVEIMTGEFGFL